MGRLPVLKPREVVAILESLGFMEIRQRGSHKQVRHPDGRTTTVPFHQGRDLSPLLLRQIAKDIGLTVDDLLANRATPSSSYRSFFLRKSSRRVFVEVTSKTQHGVWPSTHSL